MDQKLYEAAASGNIIFLQEITDPKLDLDQVTPQKNTVLHIAVNFKQLEFSKQVLGLCPSLLLKANAKGESPLHAAAKIGCFEIAEHLVNSAKTLYLDVESRVVDVQKELLRMVNQDKDTALHVAVRKGHLGVAKLLMEADPGLLESVNSANASPLYLAVDGKFSDIAKCILEFSTASHFGCLSSAVFRQQHDIVQVLLKKRPDTIKEVDKRGWTPLHHAARSGSLQITRLLLQFDSSTAYLLDKDGTSALHVAALEGHIHIVKELIKVCPDIAELTDKKGRTALHVAIIHGQERMVRYILKKSKLASIINEQDEEGNTALHLAVINKRDNVVKYLALDKRVEKTARNKKFSTARGIFLSQRNQPFWSAAKTYYFLTGPGGLPYYRLFSDGKRKWKGEASNQAKSAKKKSDKKIKSTLEINLLVAMLIATVTFQAAFTMPGGYDEKGMATFTGKAMFKAFVIFNAGAFCFSIAAVFFHFGTAKQCYSFRIRYTNLAMAFIFCALCGMVLAFASAVYLVLAKSKGLALTTYIMAASCLLGYEAFLFVDPVNGTGHFSEAREYLRNLLFRYGII